MNKQFTDSMNRVWKKNHPTHINDVKEAVVGLIFCIGATLGAYLMSLFYGQ